MHNRPFRKCALPQCSGLRFNLVHKFPRRQEKLQQWLDAIGSQRLNNTSQDRLNLLWICSRHFRVDDYVNPQSKTLNGAAIPSLNLRDLNDLDKCRQGDVEKATVLTAEEIDWMNEIKHKDQEATIAASKAATSTTSSRPTINSISTSNAAFASQVSDIQNAMRQHINRVANQPPPIPQPPQLPQPQQHPQPPEPTVTTTHTCMAEEDDSADFTLFLDDGFIEINDFKLGRNYELNSLWLRSLCRCALCFDLQNCMQKINVFELPPDVQPIMANVSDETTKLEIVWDDGHTSTYDLNKIYTKIQAQKLPRPPALTCHILWSSQETRTGDDFLPVPCYDILTNHHNIIPTALRRLQRTGVLVITALPRSAADSVLKRTLISKLFNHVWDNLTAEKRSKFCAAHYTPFTNCTFESMDKGLQILTVPYHKENLTIKLSFADGYGAASQLQKLNKVSYDFLTKYLLEYSYMDRQGYSHKTKNTIININDQYEERIMFSPHHLDDVKIQDFNMVANHSKKFSDLLKVRDNQWHLDVNAETLVILDNYRICWCIAKHHADNELDCLYMERRHFISSLHKLKQ